MLWKERLVLVSFFYQITSHFTLHYAPPHIHSIFKHSFYLKLLPWRQDKQSILFDFLVLYIKQLQLFIECGTEDIIDGHLFWYQGHLLPLRPLQMKLIKSFTLIFITCWRILGFIRLLDITVDIPVCSIKKKKNWHSFSGVFDVQPSTPYPELKSHFMQVLVIWIPLKRDRQSL